MLGIEPVKVGIVGCGSISKVYFENLTKRFGITQIKKCCSRGMASARAKAEEYGVEACTFEEMLADPEIEIIINLTPAEQHYGIIKAALLAGKHVYTEKVITPGVDQTKELIALAESKGLYLCSAPEHFMGSALQNVRDLIDKGMIGTVTSCNIMSSVNVATFVEVLAFVNETAGGVAFDFGVYQMAAMVALFGPVKKINGMVITRFPDKVYKNAMNPLVGQKYTYKNEDLLVSSIEFESGVLATFQMSGCAAMPMPRTFMIYGTEGALSLPDPTQFSGDVHLYRNGCPEPVLMPSNYGFPHDSRGVGVAEMAWSIRMGRVPRTEAGFGLHCLEALSGLVKASAEDKTYYMTTTCERPRPLPSGHLGHFIISYDEEGAIIN